MKIVERKLNIANFQVLHTLDNEFATHNKNILKCFILSFYIKNNCDLDMAAIRITFI